MLCNCTVNHSYQYSPSIHRNLYIRRSRRSSHISSVRLVALVPSWIAHPSRGEGTAIVGRGSTHHTRVHRYPLWCARTPRRSRNVQHYQAKYYNRQPPAHGASICIELFALSTCQGSVDCAAKLVDNFYRNRAQSNPLVIYLCLVDIISDAKTIS